MTVQTFKQFIGPSYVLQDPDSDFQDTENLYPEINEIGTAKNANIGSLINTPGLDYAVLPDEGPSGANRGSYLTSNGRSFRVIGDKLYELTGDVAPFDMQEWGTLSTDEGQVRFADSGNIMCLVDGPFGYGFNLSADPGPINTFYQITDENFVGATFVAFLSGYFIFNEPGTFTFYWSKPYLLEFNGLDFSGKGVASDPIVALAVYQQELQLYGSQTTESWQISSDLNGNETFVLMPGRVFQQGCAAPGSVTQNKDGVMFVAQDVTGLRSVVNHNGQYMTPMSTVAIDLVLQQMTADEINSIIGGAYYQAGHSFYEFNQGTERNWYFDQTVSTQLKQLTWHKRTWSDNGLRHRHRGNDFTTFKGYVIVGDWENSNVYYFNRQKQKDIDNYITRIRQACYIANSSAYVFHRLFQLDCTVGTGRISDDISVRNPRVMLDWSDDGGKTWSNKLSREVGAVGKYKTQVRWNRLGKARNRIYRITFTDPVEFKISGAFVDISTETTNQGK